jgi:hypothetical protein
MTALDYLTEAPHNCLMNDINAMAFEEATKIIRGHNVVEEFLTYVIFPLSDDWDLEIKMSEALLLKVTVLMPKMAATIGKLGTEAAFETRIASVSNRLVGSYGPTEHHACVGQLHHGCLNTILNWLA